MTSLGRRDLKLILGALIRATEFEEQFTRACTPDFGEPDPKAKENIRRARSVVARYNQLSAKISDLLKRPGKTKAGKP